MRKIVLKILSVLALMASASIVQADLSAPAGIDSTSVLSKGIWNPRFNEIFTSMDKRFGTDGKATDLAAAFNRPVTWQDVVSIQSKEQQPMVKGALVQKSFDLNGKAGDAIGSVKSFVDIKVPVFALGLTDRMTVAVAVPIYHIQVSSSTGFINNTGSHGTQDFINMMSSVSAEAGTEASRQFQDPVNLKLSSLNYEPISSKNVTQIGDVQLVSKYKVYEERGQSVTIRGGLGIPTGAAPNPDRLVDTATSDGQFDMSVKGIYNVTLLSDFEASLSAGYLEKLPDQLVRRIPVSADEILTSDKEMVSRKRGDQIALATGLTYNLPYGGFSLGSGYAFQYQMGSQFHGNAFSKERYEFLEAQNPSASLHSLTVTTGFSSVDWYRKKKFFYPFEASLAYGHPLAGRNTGTNDIYSAEFVLFF